MKPLKLILLIAFVFSFIGCKKYDQGPAFSLRTKKARLVNDWARQEVTNKTKLQKGCVFFPPCSYNYGIEFKSNFTYVNTGVAPSNGIWKFSENKSAIELIMDDPTVQARLPEKMKILRLTNDELWVSFNLDDSEYEYKFNPVAK